MTQTKNENESNSSPITSLFLLFVCISMRTPHNGNVGSTASLWWFCFASNRVHSSLRFPFTHLYANCLVALCVCVWMWLGNMGLWTQPLMIWIAIAELTVRVQLRHETNNTNRMWLARRARNHIFFGQNNKPHNNGSRQNGLKLLRRRRTLMIKIIVKRESPPISIFINLIGSPLLRAAHN